MDSQLLGRVPDFLPQSAGTAASGEVLTGGELELHGSGGTTVDAAQLVETDPLHALGEIING